MRVFSRLLPIVAIVVLTTAAYAASSIATSRLTLVVDEQHALVQQGEDMVLKIRLSPGVAAKLWVDATCDSPPEVAKTIVRSGTYVFAIRSLGAPTGAYSCLASSDGRLRATVPIR